MKSLLPFQRLPRWLRRHKLLRLYSRLSGKGPVRLVRVNDHFDAFIDVRDGFARLIAIEETFETGFFDLAEQLLPDRDPVFVDVGANFGLLSLGLWHLTDGRLRARLYEPNPHLCEIIHRSIQHNRATGLELSQGAAMARSGEVSLHFSFAHTGGGYVGDDPGGIRVPAIVLDEDLSAAGLSRVDLLKIDVEGNEGEVLAGLRESLETRRIGAVYFEYCPAHIRRSKARFDPVEILLSAGYEVFVWSPDSIFELGKPTHQLISGGGFPLISMQAPPEVRNTDLLALPTGRALPIR